MTYDELDEMTEAVQRESAAVPWLSGYMPGPEDIRRRAREDFPRYARFLLYLAESLRRDAAVDTPELAAERREALAAINEAFYEHMEDGDGGPESGEAAA